MRIVGRLLLALTLLALAQAGTAAQRTLVLGAVHHDPDARYAAMRPLADYVQQALAPYGIESVEILIVPNHAQTVNLMRDGRIDWVSETAFGAVYLQRRTGGEYLARKWKDGAATYRSVFFARRDRGIDNVEDLANRIVAFEHRNSTSGFFLPASMMIQRELPLDALATPRETPRADAFGYVYSGNEYNTAIWVHKGLVDAGVLSDSDWRNRDIMPASFIDDLVVFERSRPMPRSVEVVRAGLGPEVKRALFAALSRMHEDASGRAALATYDDTARFDALTEEDLQSLDDIAAALPEFRAQFP